MSMMGPPGGGFPGGPQPPNSQQNMGMQGMQGMQGMPNIPNMSNMQSIMPGMQGMQGMGAPVMQGGMGSVGGGGGGGMMQPPQLQSQQVVQSPQQPGQQQIGPPQSRDVPVLKYPEDLGLHTTLGYDLAANMLQRAVQLSVERAYQWTYVDKPQEGQLICLFVQPGAPLPPDGIRYQENEQRSSVPVPGPMARELEIAEVKYGFIPSSGDTSAWRVRRTYRLRKGGHPNLILLHYTRGPGAPIMPALANAPVRNYPLRPINEPSLFVLGDKVGQKVMVPPGAGGPMPGVPGMPGGIMSGGPGPVPGIMGGIPPTPGGIPGHGGPPPPIGMGGGVGGPGGGLQGAPPGMAPPFGTPHAMVAQQNRNMEALERRGDRERVRERSSGGGMPGAPPYMAGVPGVPGAPPGVPGMPPGAMGRRPPPPQQQRPPMDDDESADEADLISSRTLAQTRYKRNHELMNEVFTHAAYGKLKEKELGKDKDKDKKLSSPYAIFDKAEMEAKIAKLQSDIDALRKAAEDRKMNTAIQESSESMQDVQMQSFSSEGIAAA